MHAKSTGIKAEQTTSTKTIEKSNKMFQNGIELLRTVSASSSSSSSSSSIDDVVSSTTNKTPSEITIDDIDQLCDDKNHIKDVQIEQFAQRVLEFSSQYGSDYSISYTACNITGRPSKYPNYGDFPETFAMVSETRFWWFWEDSLSSCLIGSERMAIGGIWRHREPRKSCHRRYQRIYRRTLLVMKLITWLMLHSRGKCNRFLSL